jgi:hypothetical protein
MTEKEKQKEKEWFRSPLSFYALLEEKEKQKEKEWFFAHRSLSPLS